MWDDRTAEGDDGGDAVFAGGGTGESNGGGVGRRVVGWSADMHDDPRRPLTPSPCFLPFSIYCTTIVRYLNGHL
jgi:hypothetical protein